MKKITGKTYLDWYENMLLWRKFEDKLAAKYIQQKIRGFLHLYQKEIGDPRYDYLDYLLFLLHCIFEIVLNELDS